ncbi:MAG: adenylate/guanylate cyclase domain-containing protein [Symploca sp. SIO2C1]|nr:adenylate/guanylate cyclase domain-containing protein [Symploca sp. SIO2C1]
MIENYSHSFNETVGKVSQLGIDDVGELAKLKDNAQMLKERLELANEPNLMLTYLEMQSSEKEYLSTREEDKMQSMSEASQRLRNLILISSKLDATQRSEILAYLDKYKSAVVEIVKFDQEIEYQLDDFDEKSHQVSQQLIALIESEVQQADRTIDLIIRAAKIVLVVALIISVLAAGTVAKQFVSALKILAIEKKNSERLLLNILPKSIAERLKQEEGKIADSFTSVTVLFADIVGFTELAAQISPEELVGILNVIFSEFDQLTEKHNLEKIKTIGDAYMVVGGLPEEKPDHAAAMAAMAIDMQEAISRFSQETGNALSIRIGINTGPVVAGIIGRKKFVYDLWGDTVNIASRMESHGIPGGIQVSETTYQQLKHQYLFQDRGSVQVKGKGQMNCYLLKGKQNLLAAD